METQVVSLKDQTDIKYREAETRLRDAEEKIKQAEEKIKIVELDQKLQDLETNKKLDELEIERLELNNNQIRNGTGGWSSSLDQLIAVSKAYIIDNEKSIIGSDPVLKSIWDEIELGEIKSLIMKKVRKL